MLETVLGNNTIEKILFILESYGQTYPSEISKLFNISVNGVQQQMDRLENGGVIVSSKVGRTRLYKFNPRYPFLKELRALTQRAMDFLPEAELRKYYQRRTRPRKRTKP